MSDDRDLDRLKAALIRTEPAPDPARKADALARAMAEFDRVQKSAQGSADRPRQMSDRPDGAGIWTGAAAMFSKFTTRAMLAGTASVAVVGVGILVVGPQQVRLNETAPTPPLNEAGGPATPTPSIQTAATDEGATSLPTEELANSSIVAAAPVPEAAIPEAMAPEPAPQRTAETKQAERDLSATGGATAMADAEDAAVLGRERRELSTPAEVPVDMVELEMAADQPMITGATSSYMAEPMPAPMPGYVDAIAPPEPNTEAFPEAEPNPLKVTAEEPVSTFSIDVDTASYAVARSSLNAGYLPDPDAVRIEEMVNYFPYAWPAPDAGEGPFRPTVSVMPTPWNEGTELVAIALKGEMPPVEDRPALNLVFLIDTSGSMQDANKLPLLKQSFRLMLAELRPEDQVAIVTYAGSAGMVLAPTSASDRATITAALERLEAGGSTAGQAGLRQAYQVARKMAGEGEVTRVLLATDGDFNVGISDPSALEEYIARERESGVYLSVLGFGRGNLDDATMQALAQNGNGTAAYIDTLTEARKVLVDQLSGALFPIANDVKIQVEWNPATVAEYRLIGYETRALAREDFNNDKVDAGEIGAGHSVTAIYEITPVGSAARMTEPLRYAAPEGGAEAGTEGELGFLRLRYKEPGEATSNLIETPILTDGQEGGQEARFAAAIAGMGQLLKGEEKYLGDWGWDQAIALANAAKGDDPFGYRAEAVTLMRLAQSLTR